MKDLEMILKSLQEQNETLKKVLLEKSTVQEDETDEEVIQDPVSEEELETETETEPEPEPKMDYEGEILKLKEDFKQLVELLADMKKPEVEETETETVKMSKEEDSLTTWLNNFLIGK